METKESRICPNNAEFNVKFKSNKTGFLSGFLADFDIVRSNRSKCVKNDAFSSVSLQTGDGRYVLTRFNDKEYIQLIGANSHVNNNKFFAGRHADQLEYTHDKKGKKLSILVCFNGF